MIKAIWCVQRAGRRSERGVLRFRTWRGLSHLGLTGLGGWVTSGHAAGGTQRPGFHLRRRNTLSLYVRIKTRLTSRGCDEGGNQHLSETPVGLGCGGYIYPSCRARTNHYSSRMCIWRHKGLCAGEKPFNGLSWKCRLGTDLETLSPLSLHSSSHTLLTSKSDFAPMNEFFGDFNLTKTSNFFKQTCHFAGRNLAANYNRDSSLLSSREFDEKFNSCLINA